jgi:hypothetical protein
MFRILKTFIKAERTLNWELHLQTTVEMLLFFAAAGHSNYLKSIYVYVENMISLKETNPLLYDQLKSGYHVIQVIHVYNTRNTTILYYYTILLHYTTILYYYSVSEIAYILSQLCFVHILSLSVCSFSSLVVCCLFLLIFYPC